MLRKKNFTLNGKKATGKEILKSGDVVTLYLSDETYARFSEETSPVVLPDADPSALVICFEDEDLLAVNKPAGLLSQKAKPSDVSLNEIILSYLSKTGSYDGKDGFTPSVMNRLDRNTSGLVMAAKSLRGAQFLADALKTHRIRKEYHAIVSGRLSAEGTVVSYWMKDSRENRAILSDVPAEGAKRIESSFFTTGTGGGLSSLRIQIKTGRTHQIRSQLAALSHPILFDPKYGDRQANRRYAREFNIEKPRQLLHAYRAVLPDDREIIAEEPEDFTLVREAAQISTIE